VSALAALAAPPSDLAMDRVSFLIQGIEAVGSDQGAGDPLLLIHGWGGGSSHWRLMWPELATRYRCIAPDLPGWGDSEKPKAPYTLEWYADWLAALLESRGASPAYVAGHSMGATIALVLAQRHPGRVRKLALLNPVVRGSDGLKKRARILSKPGLRRVAYWLTRNRWFLRYLTRNFTERVGGLEEADMLLVGKGTFKSMIRSLNGLKSVDLTPSLRSMSTPTLVIGSEADREIAPEQSVLATGIPGARLEMLKGCGHVSPLERPREAARLLIEFFGPGMRQGRPPQW
jgi:pimeloyl-ACP methyl ester carboxylesterase